MGIFLPCLLPLHSTNLQHSDQIQSEIYSNLPEKSSLASQPSLPSVPSLTPVAGGSSAQHHCITAVKAHSSYIFSLAIAGKHLYSGSSDGEIRVWDRAPSNSPHNHNTIAEINSAAVKSILISGYKLFTAHQDHKIRVWKIDSYSDDGYHHKSKLIAVLPTVTDRCLRLFNAKNYVQVRRHKKSTWIHHVDAVSALALSGDGAILYSASWDRTVKIWRTSDFKCLESIQNAHDDAINAVVLSSDGVVYTGSADKKIKIWKRNADDGENRHSLVLTLEKHKSAVNALALSSDGAVLYSGACDRSIIVWGKDGSGHMAVAGALRGHTKAILCLTVVSDLLCSGSADQTVRVWRREIGNYACVAVIDGHRNPVKSLTAAVDCRNVNNDGESGDSYLVYSGGLDGEIRVNKIWLPLTY